MKKVCLFFVFFLMFITVVHASTGIVVCPIGNTTSLNVSEDIGGNVIGRLECDSSVEILNNNSGSDDFCSVWYHIKQGSLEGYSCGEYITIDTDVDVNDDQVARREYRETLKNAGFPESYLDDLVELHFEYPNWVFTPFETGLDWDTVIETESVGSKSLVHSSFGIGYRRLCEDCYNWEKDEYYRHPTEINWWYANSDAIAYFMDPRNYLGDYFNKNFAIVKTTSIFAFESLSYAPSYQTVQAVDKILGNSFMPDVYKIYSNEPYTNAFMTAAEAYNISPLHLASRIRQEQGLEGTIASFGDPFVYNDVTYSGYFNFYNIYGSGTNPAIQGLVWAMGGADQTGTSYNRPWDTPYKSIVGGARYISQDYISIGQDTLYFQKFDVSRGGACCGHQYMQNITAPITEGAEIYSSYSQINGLLDEPLVFIIPIYDNMPENRVEAPVNKSPNGYLKSIKIDNKEIEGFIYNKLNYEMAVDGDISSVNVTGDTINDNANISGVGTIILNDGENKIEIVVTAENGNKIIYTVTIDRQKKEEDIVLSDVNTLKSLTIDIIDFEFDKDTLEYNLLTSFENDRISLSYELDDNNASVEASKDVDLIVGTNKINIIVTAENGSTRTYILNITRQQVTINEALNRSGVKYNDNYIFGIKVGSGVNSLVENIKDVSNSVSVIIKDKEDKIKQGVFATGDKVMINTGVENKTYDVLIYGDVNGDAVIDKLDYLEVLRHYYKYQELSGASLKAADANRDGAVDKLDFLVILRDYYNYKKIEQ